MNEHHPPRIENGFPDQDGNPGFYLYLPITGFDQVRAGLLALVPADHIAWSACPPAFWIAAEYRASVLSYVTAQYGYAQELTEGEPIKDHFYRRREEVEVA